ncbi:MAG: N-6 DNA methylase [Chloroflexota bacterium]|nr:N-6 DNA methylase [Chloroflexota bacterium]
MRHAQTQDAIYQASFLSVLPAPAVANEKVYADVFRKLYYHFYANSHASRAERIMADLSNLLLCKIAGERTPNADLARFIQGEGTANTLLIPLLQAAFPQLIDASEQFYLQDDLLRQGLRELEPLAFHAAPAHILGEAFQALMGPRLRGDKGQFFTPKSLVRVMIAILSPPPTAKIVDPACGTAGFLVEAQAFQVQHDPAGAVPSGPLIGMDKDRDLCRLAEATLEIVAPARSVVLNRNSLDFAALATLSSAVSPLEADYVITNPPFGAKIKVTDRDILRQYVLGHKWTLTADGWLEEGGLREAQDPQILFLELCIKLLRPGGQLGIVLPEGVFGNHTLGYVWDFVRRQGTITALLDCPRTTFQPSTDTKTNVLFFRKAVAPFVAPLSDQAWTAVALHCGHDRRGRSTKAGGEPYPDDFASIGVDYAQHVGEQRFWQYSTITNPYYLVPRYYDQAPLQELTAEARRIDTRLVSLGELVKRRYISLRKGHEVGAEAYGSGDIPFVRTSDIANYEVSIDSTRGVSEEVYQQYADQQRLAPGDILMVADGRYRIGRLAILHGHNHRCVVQSHLRIISVQATAPFRAVELLYLLNLPMVQHQIRNLVFIQSTLGSLGSRLHDICVPLPKPTPDWERRITEFAGLIEGRATLLQRLRAFEPGDYEL